MSDLSSKNFSIQQTELLKQLNDLSIPVSEKIGKLFISLNAIDSKPQILSVFQELKLAKSGVVSSYNLISNNLQESLLENLDSIFELKLKNLTTEKNISSLSQQIKEFGASDKSANTTSHPSYSSFLEKYSDVLATSQEILKKKVKVECILETQSLLDKSFASKMVEVDSQLLKLNEIIDSFQDIRNPEFIISSSPQFNFFKKFEDMVVEKDNKFDEVKKNLHLEANGELSMSKFETNTDHILNKDFFKPINSL